MTLGVQKHGGRGCQDILLIDNVLISGVLIRGVICIQ